MAAEAQFWRLRGSREHVQIEMNMYQNLDVEYLKNNLKIVKIDKNKSLFNYEKKILINELILDAGYKTRLAANYNQALAEIDKNLPSHKIDLENLQIQKSEPILYGRARMKTAPPVAMAAAAVEAAAAAVVVVVAAAAAAAAGAKRTRL